MQPSGRMRKVSGCKKKSRIANLRLKFGGQLPPAACKRNVPTASNISLYYVNICDGSEGPQIISRDDEWAWIIAEPLPGIPHGTENNTMPGPGAEKVRRNEAWYGRVFDAGGELLIRILCHIHIHLVHPSHIHIHLQQGGGRHLGWQQHLAINSLGW